MLRGINKQNIFDDDEDRERFYAILADVKLISGFKLYAFCLMNNHVHLLLKVESEQIEQIFKRIGTRYVYWYNWKYERSGHLFHDRFKSEPVEDDAYFLTVLRYIHYNPVKASICKTMDAFPWSSYVEYKNEARLVDIDFALGMMSKEEFVLFHEDSSEDRCLDCDVDNRPISESEAKQLIFEICKTESVAEFQQLNEHDRENCIKSLREAGLSIRQLSRMTGVSIGIIRRILR